MPKRTTYNAQALFWATLKNPDYKIFYQCQRVKSPRDLARFGILLATTRDNEIHDMCIANLMTRDWAPEKIVAVMSAWLRTYRVPMDPSKLATFDEFRRRHGNYVGKKGSGPYSFTACLKLDKSF